jgi:hypothetical protein
MHDDPADLGPWVLMFCMVTLSGPVSVPIRLGACVTVCCHEPGSSLMVKPVKCRFETATVTLELEYQRLQSTYSEVIVAEPEIGYPQTRSFPHIFPGV